MIVNERRAFIRRVKTISYHVYVVVTVKTSLTLYDKGSNKYITLDLRRKGILDFDILFRTYHTTTNYTDRKVNRVKYHMSKL